MGNVYRIGSMYGTEYCNTSREADQTKPNDEEPESVTKVDAAAECNRLNRQLDEAERTFNTLRCVIMDLVMVCPADVVHKTEAGKRAQKFLKDNPLPPATCADRDGQRSYGV